MGARPVSCVSRMSAATRERDKLPLEGRDSTSDRTPACQTLFSPASPPRRRGRLTAVRSAASLVLVFFLAFLLSSDAFCEATSARRRRIRRIAAYSSSAEKLTSPAPFSVLAWILSLASVAVSPSATAVIGLSAAAALQALPSPCLSFPASFGSFVGSPSSHVLPLPRTSPRSHVFFAACSRSLPSGESAPSPLHAAFLLPCLSHEVSLCVSSYGPSAPAASLCTAASPRFQCASRSARPYFLVSSLFGFCPVTRVSSPFARSARCSMRRPGDVSARQERRRRRLAAEHHPPLAPDNDGEDDDPLADVDAFLDRIEREEVHKQPRRTFRASRADAPFFKVSDAPREPLQHALRGLPSSRAWSSQGFLVGSPPSSPSQLSPASAVSSAGSAPTATCAVHSRDARGMRGGSVACVSSQDSEMAKQEEEDEDWGEGDVTVDRDAGADFPLDEGLLARQAEAVLAFLGLRAFSASVHLVTPEQIRELNRSSRGADVATDVLAFPSRPSPGVYREMRHLLSQSARRGREVTAGDGGSQGAGASSRGEAGDGTEWAQAWRTIRLRSPADLTLGEVYFCTSVIQQQVEADRAEIEGLARRGLRLVLRDTGIKGRLKPRLSVQERLPLLFMHAALHLIGFDHEEAHEAREMEAVEEALLAKFLKAAQPRALLQGGGPLAPHFLVGSGLDVCAISRIRRFILAQVGEQEEARRDSEQGAQLEVEELPLCEAEDESRSDAAPAEGDAAQNPGNAAPAEAEESGILPEHGCMYTSRLRRALARILTPLEVLEFLQRFCPLHAEGRQTPLDKVPRPASPEKERNSSVDAVRQDSDFHRNLQRASEFLAGRFAAKEALAKALGGAGLRNLSPGKSRGIPASSKL
ncbi:4'-phosphopantetheinyl transferase domain-containing protein [Besnoitia besnoiti]|uniref:4'-phosphopantetheinyl transferase domain-containing protein n=1 Tax=Besnoitia besnoiti TaxID=94643 RepID=A0A2A9MF25_BESBE|nr:4'-phosphopantetheinyl transferase domain-containing protein [Besnoitia besnoiti]PFH34546.1 4'-phosphopantetheinyl transferase domain-containing protein [Besnoitia besnoiti]